MSGFQVEAKPLKNSQPVEGQSFLQAFIEAADGGQVDAVSGGQTGVDRAALDIALELGIPCGGWCPKGRLAEDGPLPERYPLQETPSSQYPQRTEWNVRDSDGTLILTFGDPTRGTALTIQIAERLKKPCLTVNLKQSPSPKEVLVWIQGNGIHLLLCRTTMRSVLVRLTVAAGFDIVTSS